MFLFDDSKDSDTDEMKNIENAAKQNRQPAQTNANAPAKSGWGNRLAAQNTKSPQNAQNNQSNNRDSRLMGMQLSGRVVIVLSSRNIKTEM